MQGADAVEFTCQIGRRFELERVGILDSGPVGIGRSVVRCAACELEGVV